MLTVSKLVKELHGVYTAIRHWTPPQPAESTTQPHILFL